VTEPRGNGEVRRSIATAALGGSLDNRLSAASHAGFDAVELAEGDFVADFRSSTQLRRRAADLGVTIEAYQPLRLLHGATAQAAVTLERVRRKLDLVAELGARVLVVTSSHAPGSHGANDEWARQLAAIAEEAMARHLAVAYRAEPDPLPAVALAQVWRVVEEADQPNLGLCIDTGHIVGSDDGLAVLDQIPADRVFHLQVTDIAEAGGRLGQATDDEAGGALSLPSVVARIRAAGYTGPLTARTSTDDLMNRDPERAARSVMRSLLVLEDTARRKLEAETTPTAVARTLARIPAAVELSGYAFVELSVDGGSAAAVEVQFQHLGLEPIGRHRTKSVTMWGRQQARVLLNTTGRELLKGRPVDAVVSAFGVDSEDPVAATERAEYLRAHSLFRRRAKDEAELTAVAAPDGTEVFYCSSRPDGPGAWLGDFEPTDTRRDVPDGHAGVIQAVDHVALPYEPDRFDEAVGFFSTILGLEPQDLVQLPGVSGALRSRALCSESRGFRLALNVISGTSRPRSGPPAQHIAFACHDVLAAAAAFRSSGVGPLGIPDNYYDDLATRTELSQERVDELRTWGVLYDSDERGGEFLHMYTPLVGERLFFEVVERRGGYDGYAARNAPVRVSAHRR
jgi:4-hydroxyphenylpyruvate dioxygenase